MQQLRQTKFIEEIQDVLLETHLSGERLKLEITESCLLQAADRHPNVLERLKDFGIRLCIDDFGTGYSSLSRLHEMPIDTLKIDRAFVRRLDTDEGGKAIVRTIVALAHTLGMDTVVEGIETEAQEKKLKKLGCEYAQGYLYAKPLDATAARALFENPILPPLSE